MPRRQPRIQKLLICLPSVLTLFAFEASATETTTYTYDALGRLVSTKRIGGPGNAEATYSYDDAGNRTNVNVDTTIPSMKVIVVPLNGFTVIPIPNN
jgi:hypothetical protein